MTAIAIQEKRSALRVAAGRPGRLRFNLLEQEISVHCDIVDLSVSGCRLVMQRKALPSDQIKLINIEVELQLETEPGKQFAIKMSIVWCQYFRQSMLVAGARFIDLPINVAKSIDSFVISRQRVGLELAKNTNNEQEEDDLRTLQQQLEIEGTNKGLELPHPYRFGLLKVGARRMQAIYAPKEGENPLVPAKGQILELSIYPPAWVGVELRALRFVGRVVEADQNQIILEFCSSGHDISQMIFALIPAKKIKPKKEFNLVYIIIALLIVIIYLLSS